MVQKIAFITGITGQDGAYLAQFLLDKNYSVYGMQQLSATPNTQNIDYMIGHDNFHLVNGDMSDASNIAQILKQIMPDEIYNLAGQSHVGVSFDMPDYTAQINGLGTLRLLESVRLLGLSPRIYNASTSEIFGNADTSPQDENTPFNPCSPYAAAKIYAHHIAQIYRNTYNIHVSNGISFNHESPIRGEEFVTRKITKSVSAIRNGTQQVLELGNLDAHRDWGHASDYVRGMWMMLQQDTPDDYVLATGQSYSVRDFTNRCFAHVGIDIKWTGSGLTEIGIDKKTNSILVKIDPQLYRPNDVHALLGNAAKANKILGWKPDITIDNLISEMMDFDYLKNQPYPTQEASQQKRHA